MDESQIRQRIDEYSTVILGARLMVGKNDDELCEGYLVQKPEDDYEAHFSGGREVDMDRFLSVLGISQGGIAISLYGIRFVRKRTGRAKRR